MITKETWFSGAIRVLLEDIEHYYTQIVKIELPEPVQLKLLSMLGNKHIPFLENNKIILNCYAGVIGEVSAKFEVIYELCRDIKKSREFHWHVSLDVSNYYLQDPMYSIDFRDLDRYLTELDHIRFILEKLEENPDLVEIWFETEPRKKESEES